MSRDPITCHVLDTTTGNTAKDVACRLTLILADGTVSFFAKTDSDGRVAKWEGPSLPAAYKVGQRQSWNLKFETGLYYQARGIEPFFNDVQVNFTTGAGEPREHFHVPLLVGPYNYTTYRGS